MVNVNDFSGKTDSDRIETALTHCNGVLVITPRISEVESERDYWLIDRAILIPENTTVVLQNCKIKLSDQCRDNFFRTANCGLGIDEPKHIKNVHIRGEGHCLLEGADHPRSTGDSGKVLACPCPKTKEDLLCLADWIPEESKITGSIQFADKHSHSYGTDVDKEGESKCGDWRNIGILFANVSDFSIENLKISDYHGWGISLEACSDGCIEKIDFDACMSKEIDGMIHNIENQDGIDLRNGCHDITISDITGATGDDIIALTAIVSENQEYRPGGSLASTHVMHNDYSKRDANIYNIMIKNVRGYSKGGAQEGCCSTIRLLPIGGCKIWNVIIDGVIDNTPDGITAESLFLLGVGDGYYGKTRKESLSNIIITNIISKTKRLITVDGYLQDALISNVINKNPNCPIVTVRRKDALQNVRIESSLTKDNELIHNKF